jgi:hypothetical protein
MKAPWNEPRGYRTLTERQVSTQQARRLHDWREDARIYLFIGWLVGLFVGAAIGIGVGIWLAR